MSPELLANLRCPQTQEPLRLATQEEFEQLHARFPFGNEHDAARIEGAIISAESQHCYPIVEELPLLVASESIQLSS